jgi:hypothetical protein
MPCRFSPPRGGFFFAILALLGSLVTAQAATLLPNGKQTFINANGAPLALGTVTMYVPGTTTAKTTWQDSAQTIQNTNPITLGIDGTAVIYGSGCYRQIVKDASGSTIWDQPTCDVSSTSLIWAGHSSGTANNQILTASNFSSQDGQTVAFLAGQTNTGALALTINGGSPINVLRDTASGPFSLAGGEVFLGNNYLVQYDATRGAFHLVNNPATGSNPLSTLSGSGTTDLGSASSRFVNITGSATITSFGSSASTSFPLYSIIFGGSSIVATSASLIVPGNANITTLPGDYALAAYLGSGNWKILTYTRAIGLTLLPVPIFQQVGSCPWTIPTAAGILPSRVDFQIVGGGGGGGGNGNDGGAGGASAFNGITVGGGAGGVHSTTAFGVDGGAGGSGGAGSASLRVSGQSGFGSPPTEGGVGVGASVGLGGAGGRSPYPLSVAGVPSEANTSARQGGGIGAGGAGYSGASISVAASSGGGGGEYAEGMISFPGSSTIACSLGTGGTAGTSAGTGGAGAIFTRSYWQ